MGRLGERKKVVMRRSPKKKFYVAVRRERKLYLLAVPDCLRCAQYAQNDSVMPFAVLQNLQSPRFAGSTWLCTAIQTAD
jgi:hypothetical protein